MTPYRIGLVVPSSNVTIEAELPRLLARHRHATFTFHASRMRMKTVSAEELTAMNAQRERCVDEVADADVDAIVYGCLVAIMTAGHSAHEQVERAISRQLRERGRASGVLSSAGALVEALHALRARRVALVTPYVRPLAEQVSGYLAAEGFGVSALAALGEPDNARVARISGERVMAAARGLDLSGADVLVISACVQMPSLDVIERAEAEFGLPVISAGTAGAWVLLRRLGLTASLPGAGRLLATPEFRESAPSATTANI